MLLNYFKVAIRNLLKHKLYSFINIAGLGIGLAAFILIALYVRFEFSFDQYHTNKDRIYRVAAPFGQEQYAHIAKVTDLWGPGIKEGVAQVEAMTRFVFRGQALFEFGDTKSYERGGFYTDASVFDMFSFDVLAGDPATALADPGSIVLTKSLAEKYFGDENPLGREIQIDGETTYKVTGVMANARPNSHFTYNYFVSLSTYSHPQMGDWRRWNQFYTYVMLEDGVTAQQVMPAIDEVIRTGVGEENFERAKPYLQPMTSIHLHSRMWREMSVNSDFNTVMIFALIGTFILLVACVNFVNLVTAKSGTRAGEVGIRKAIGAQRQFLIRQFLGEALLSAFIATTLAVILCELLTVPFQALVGQPISMNYLGDPFVISVLLILPFLVALIAGSYPALVLSRPEAASILRRKDNVAGGKFLRKGLVIFQFAISAVLIISVGIVTQQVNYMLDRPLGYNAEHVIVIPIADRAIIERYEAVKTAIGAVDGVQNVSFAGNRPGGSDFGMPVQIDGMDREDQPSLRALVGDVDYLNTLQFEMASGRSFSADFETDKHGVFVVNEEFARQVGWDSHEGKTMTIPFLQDFANKEVVGIVKDFHFRSMREKIDPIYIFVPPRDWFSEILVRVEADDMQRTIADITDVMAQFDPVNPMTHRFFDQQIGALYAADQQLKQTTQYASALAIVIACLGLFGLAAFSVQRRTKEIGVRKALGASSTSMFGILSIDFVKLVIAGFAIAIPISWLSMDNWLSQFAYRTDIGAGVFILAGIATLAITMAVVSYQALKAARQNPVIALRSE